MDAIHTLLGFTGWTLLLVAAVFLYRGVRFLGGTPINHWPRGEKPADSPPIISRLQDAHANCIENLPIFAVIVLAAAALGRLDAINALAPWVLYARLAQTIAHLTGTGQPNVLARASFWGVQLVLFFWMLIKVCS
ncbi:MAG: MAPEG family protein [Rhizobacter sp.]